MQIVGVEMKARWENVTDAQPEIKMPHSPENNSVFFC